MATNKSTSRVRSPRNSAKATPNSPARTNSIAANPIHAISAWDAIRDAIEAERGRLMTAETILHCMVLAMDEGDDANSPHYPTLIELSREIVKRSIDQVDSVRLKAMLEKAGVRDGYVVKEGAAEYAVH